MQMRRWSLALLVLTLSACGGAAAPGTSGAGTTPQASPSAAASPAPSPAAVESPAPQASPGMNLGEVDPAVVQQVLTALSNQVGVATDRWQVVSAEAVEWPDSSLGCPQPGMMYMQVITPGYRLELSDGTRRYEVHTDRDASNVVLCQDGQPLKLGQP
ncbi:hypothetical protein [Kallotenue papyrolyticum]|uniref:hypothetical protein n=1 Tax=Kallotenue papyrolyticum TaxID=1325125 RepID=UPI0004786563|nr:hypothetical protein [Kallotenue papyrolyticum]